MKVLQVGESNEKVAFDKKDKQILAALELNGRASLGTVAKKAGLSKADAASAVDAVFETVQAELKNGGDIRLAGFGSFSVSRREASKGRNPSTGAEVDIPARNVPKFTPGKGLKEAVNG